MPISLEAKLKAIREVESIYALSKKWQRLTPGEKRPNWERLADAVLKKAMDQPLQTPAEPLNVHGGMHHEHSPRSARVIERTLRNGVVHPDALHTYSCGHIKEARARSFAGAARRAKPVRQAAQDPPAQHYVQHGATDLHYPAGHLQGFGFVARQHEVASHVQLESSQMKAAEPVPTKSASSYS